MIKTIPELLKALEDLTKAYKITDEKTSTFSDAYENRLQDLSNVDKNLLEKLRGEKNIFTKEEFFPKGVGYHDSNLPPKNILPDEFNEFSYSFEADSGDRFQVLPVLDICKEGVEYTFSCDFVAMAGNPSYATLAILDTNDKNAVIEKSDTKVIDGKCRAILTFTYKPIKEHKLALAFFAGKMGEGGGVACDYSDFKLETYDGVYDTVEPTAEQEAEAQKALNATVAQTVPYRNAIRNANGNISVPDAIENTDAINKQQLLKTIDEHIKALIDGAPESLDTLKEIADSLKDKDEAVSALITELSKKADKKELDEKIEKAKVDTIKIAGGGQVYDFDVTTGYETDDVVYINGERKPIIRLCVKKEDITNNFYINTSKIGDIEQIIKISGTVTGANGYILSAENALSYYVDNDKHLLWFVFEKQGVKHNTALIVDFITK